MPEATTFLLVGEDVMSLYCFLNSSPAEWYFSKLGPRTGEGTIRWKKYTVEQIFAPRLSVEQSLNISEIISLPLSDIPLKINNWFYRYFNFTVTEIEYINEYFEASIKSK